MNDHRKCFINTFTNSAKKNQQHASVQTYRVCELVQSLHIFMHLETLQTVLARHLQFLQNSYFRVYFGGFLQPYLYEACAATPNSKVPGVFGG